MNFTRNLAALLLCGGALGSAVAPASATSLEYKLYAVDSQGNLVNGLKTQVQVFGINVPLVGELQLNGLTMTVNDSNVKLNGQATACIGTNGCGSQYADQLFSFNTLYGVPIGHGTGQLDATLTNKLASSTPDAIKYGAQANVGKIHIDNIDPRLPENYAEVKISTKNNPSLGYAFGIFSDAQYGQDFVDINGWLVLDQFLAANSFYVETRAGGGQFDFHLVGCLVGGNAPGICGGTGNNNGGNNGGNNGSEVPEPMTMTLLASGLVAGNRLRKRKQA